MLFKTLIKLKERTGLTEELKKKIDVFYACERITLEQYNELMDIPTYSEENMEYEDVTEY